MALSLRSLWKQRLIIKFCFVNFLFSFLSIYEFSYYFSFFLKCVVFLFCLCSRCCESLGILKNTYALTPQHSQRMVASVLRVICFLLMPNGFLSAIQIPTSQPSHKLSLLEIVSCLAVHKSLG